MASPSVLSPVRGVGPPEAVHRLFRASQTQIVGEDLDDEDDDVDVVKETEVDVRHVEDDRLGSGSGIGHPDLGHIAAAEHANRRLDPPRAAVALAFAVQKAPDVGKKGDELTVMSLLKPRGIVAELVPHFGPRVAGAGLLQKFPGFLDLRALAYRQQLQRPYENLPEMPDELGLIR